MGRGVRFKTPEARVIMCVNGTRVSGPESKAEEWRKKKRLHRHTTACFVNKDWDPARSTRPVIVIEGETVTKYLLKAIWRDCDKKQCTNEGEHRLSWDWVGVGHEGMGWDNMVCDGMGGVGPSGL